MKMKRILCTSSLIAFLCSVAWTQDVKVDWDKAASFTGFHTYAWGTGTPAKNPLMAQRIVDGIDKELAAKGFQRVDTSSNPDLVVLYHASTSTQTQINTMGTGGWGWTWGGTSTTTVNEIPTGQLSVDIGDAKTKKLLWLGSASDTLSDKPEKNEQKIQKALDKMFKKFPPPAND
jgi:Domain of unknown function (DUF4136)